MHVHHRIRKPKSNDNCLNYMNIAPVYFQYFYVLATGNYQRYRLAYSYKSYKRVAVRWYSLTNAFWFSLSSVCIKEHCSRRVFSHQGATALKQSPVIMLHF